MRRAGVLLAVTAIGAAVTLGASAAGSGARFSIKLPPARHGKIVEFAITATAPANLTGVTGLIVRPQITNLPRLPRDIRAFAAQTQPVLTPPTVTADLFVAVNNLKGRHLPRALAAAASVDLLGNLDLVPSFSDLLVKQLSGDACHLYLTAENQVTFAPGLGPWPTAPQQGFGHVVDADPSCR
jgi:hypothetical protein